VVLSVVCAGLAVWFRYEAQALGSDGPGANEALAEAGPTSEVNGQIRTAVEKVFSYDFADTARTERAARELLAGQAIGEYDQLFATVRQQAPQQKLVVTTAVKSSGVSRLQGDRAEVLLFVDQNAVRTDSGQSNVGPAQISVSAVKQGDQWKISGITPR
jgi:Mce-associated membrane protein